MVATSNQRDLPRHLKDVSFTRSTSQQHMPFITQFSWLYMPGPNDFVSDFLLHIISSTRHELKLQSAYEEARGYRTSSLDPRSQGKDTATPGRFSACYEKA